MKTLSLARIMYGTSEEFHVADGVNSSASPSLPSPSSVGHADRNTRGTETLGELLHKAWTSLSNRS
jgi:hypothetical protein